MAEIEVGKSHGFLTVILAGALALVVFYPFLQSIGKIFGLSL